MATKKVLIAEDSSVIQNLTKRILTAQNFEIESAKNGNQVLDLLNKKNYDAILMDINMPGMDGMECARQIRALGDESKKSIPIIAITGNAMNYSIDDFKEAGINEYIQKPLNYDELVTTLNKFTQQ